MTKMIVALFVATLALAAFAARATDSVALRMVFVPASEKGDENDFDSLLRIVEKITGYKITNIKVTDYNAAVEAMRAGRADLAWYGAETYIKAADLAGAEAFAAGIRKGDKDASYFTYFLVPADSPIKTLADVRGKVLALNEIGSTSGDLIPQFELRKVGLSVKTPGHFKQVFYSGSHDACMLATINRRADVCGVSSRNYDARIADRTIREDQVRIVHRSDPVPPPPLSYSKRLPVEVREKLKKAVLEAHKHGSIGGYGGEVEHYVEVKDADYDTLRAVDHMVHESQGKN
jgi:phosphonate transport system substrate-binding protein